MQIQDSLAQARDSLTVKRVFGDPYEKDDVTVIPTAKIQGGGGGGEGTEGEGKGKGVGGGFGMSARPAGVFEIHGDEVSWRPAVDVNRLIFGGQVVAIIALLTVRSILRARTKARR